MPYAITYPSHDALNIALTTETAGDAAKIARQLLEKGHAPTIEKDGRHFTLAELESVAAQGEPPQ